MASSVDDAMPYPAVAVVVVVIVVVAVVGAPCERRMNAQNLPSTVGTMLTTSQPSADFRVSSAASASVLPLERVTVEYSCMVRRLSLRLRTPSTRTMKCARSLTSCVERGSDSSDRLARSPSRHSLVSRIWRPWSACRTAPCPTCWTR